jgi:hypothetical protein
VSYGDASESNHTNDRYAYEWRIPANWEFVPPSSGGFDDAQPDADVATARLRGGVARESLTLVVTRSDATSRGQPRPGEPSVLDGFEVGANKWLAQHGLRPTASSRLKYIRRDAVRVDARLRNGSTPYLSIVLFQEDDRRFELRCLSDRYAPHTPCIEAFGALVIHEPVLRLEANIDAAGNIIPAEVVIVAGTHGGTFTRDGIITLDMVDLTSHYDAISGPGTGVYSETRALAHELGHLAGYHDTSTLGFGPQMDNVQLNENPIMRQLGFYNDRLSY